MHGILIKGDVRISGVSLWRGSTVVKAMSFNISIGYGSTLITDRISLTENQLGLYNKNTDVAENGRGQKFALG